MRVLVTGAGGRMGRALINAVAASDGLELVAALDREGSSAIGLDSGTLSGLTANNIPVISNQDEAFEQAEVVLDFTSPVASRDFAKRAAPKGLVHIIGTTGCSDADEQAFIAAGQAGARIVKSGNMSLGVNLLASLVKKAAAALGSDYDIEVLEMHHNKKVDAPSGTALLLGEAAANGRQIDLADQSVRSRDGHTGPRETGTIGFAALRGGTVVGDHTVIFAGPSERIELRHFAEDRQLFANGAVKAALWAKGQKPGFYSMADVLGL